MPTRDEVILACRDVVANTQEKTSDAYYVAMRQHPTMFGCLTLTNTFQTQFYAEWRRGDWRRGDWRETIEAVAKLQTASELVPVSTRSEHNRPLLVQLAYEALHSGYAMSGGMIYTRARELGVPWGERLLEEYHSVWPGTKHLMGAELCRYVLRCEILPAVRVAYAHLQGANIGLPGREAAAREANKAGLVDANGANFGRILKLAWPEIGKGERWDVAVLRAMKFNGELMPLVERRATAAVWPTSAKDPHATAEIPLTGYAAFHAEELGVSPTQYRAARGRLFTRRSRRLAFAQQTELATTTGKPDLAMSRGCPRGRGVGPDLPYDLEDL